MIEVRSLTKRFGSVRAVDGLSFAARPGRVTAFLGPNGAGKTTTLRVALGLVRATSGDVVFDRKHYAELRRPGREVGASLEASSFHPGRTAVNHLRSLTPELGVPDSRCAEVLELVGLSAQAGRRVGEFSMGMRGRLAIACALLGDPSTLLFDEPTNGLDPEGISWMRALLRALAAQGRTVLISSHLLGEVERTVDDVVIIARGRLVHASPLAELERLSAPATLVAAADPAALAALAALARARGWEARPAGLGGPPGGTPDGGPPDGGPPGGGAGQDQGGSRPGGSPPDGGPPDGGARQDQSGSRPGGSPPDWGPPDGGAGQDQSGAPPGGAPPGGGPPGGGPPGGGPPGGGPPETPPPGHALLVRGASAAEIGLAAFAAGLPLTQLASQRAGLEQAYFQLTEGAGLP
ncbi:MAG: ATP-binding cassette domain-containing protein [Bifidobacteriaceae bacterium]|jgi:ABC-2 type transport system ATP-binding protein|nr:ATP-binding cassette domain-containing protein [Bifidobacteriaceae bacterium]